MPSDTHFSFLSFVLSFLVLCIIGAFTGQYAEKKGRSRNFWFVLTLLLGIFAPLILWFLPSLKKEDKTSQLPKEAESTTSPEEKWYYLDEEHQTLGPITLPELKQLMTNGKVDASTLVWKQGMTDWKKMGETIL